MNPYILHYFDAFEHVRRSERLDCDDDHVAIAQAASRDHPYVMEIWSGERRVWRFESALALAS